MGKQEASRIGVYDMKLQKSLNKKMKINSPFKKSEKAMRNHTITYLPKNPIIHKILHKYTYIILMNSSHLG